MASASSYKRNEQENPLAISSPSIHPSNEPTTTSPPPKRIFSRRCVVCVCSCFVVLILILGFVILILSFTLFKIKDPTLVMNSVSVKNFDLNLSLSQANLISTNLTLISNIWIQNPNIISFKFNQSVTTFYYDTEMVGVAYAPAGKAAKRSPAKMNVTVDLLLDRIVLDTNITSNVLLNGELNLTSYTGVDGRVNILGLYKKHFNVGLSCNITLGVSLSNVETQSTTCMADVKG